jgi:hypothetical protein
MEEMDGTFGICGGEKRNAHRFMVEDVKFINTWKTHE